MIIKTRSGFYRVNTKRFIDSTGDAEIAYLSGCKTIVGRKSYGKCQHSYIIQSAEERGARETRRIYTN